MDRKTTRWILLAAALLLGACSDTADDGPSDTGGDADSDTDVNTGDKQLAYLNIDACFGHANQTACEADSENDCRWASAELACPEGVSCPAGFAGFCYAPDPCAAHANEAACTADEANGCTWSAIEALSPAGSRGVDGACIRAIPGGDDCVCACPMWCPAEGDCPSCECDCAPKGGDTGGGACTCACPACAPGETCPACSCSCGAAGGGAVMPMMNEGATTCACPECASGEVCPACDCGAADPLIDPCLAHTDETVCAADQENGCAWIAMGMPCMEGMPCLSGVCQSVGGTTGGGGNGGCVCACSACAAGEICPPCSCDCGGSTGGVGCIPGAGAGGSAGSGTAVGGSGRSAY